MGLNNLYKKIQRIKICRYFLHLIIICCLSQSYSVYAQSNITRAEYFYDVDPGFGNGVSIPITPTTNISNQTFSTSVADLSSGVHQLFFRVQTADGRWSVTNRSMLYKPGASTYFTPQITRAEYFFDVDPGFGNGSGIAITPGVAITNLTFNANVENLAVGIHQMFIRVQDASGKWSISNRNLLYKPAQQSVNNNTQITKAEYFFDTEPGFGNGTNIPITPGFSIIDQAFNADVSSLSTGVHQMYIRVKDSRGVWSICNRNILFKPNDNSNNTAPNLIKAEYFYDTDPGFGNGTNIPVTPGTQLLNVGFESDVSALSTGMHQLYIRVKDANNNWSVSNRTFLYKAPTYSRQTSKIIRAEYFIDNDPGFGNAIPYPMSGTSVATDSVIAVNISGLTDGDHRFYVRTLDNFGKWSITNNSTFNVTNASTENNITVTGINKRNLCAGDSIEVGYHANGTFNSGNQFKVELSNAVGSFASPVVIGSTSSLISGSIWCSVPSGLGGNGYKIRVVGSNPTTISTPFGANFTATCISNSPPTITLNNSIDLICGGVATGSIDINVTGGTTPYQYIWTKIGSPSFSANTQDLSNLNTGTYEVIVTDALGNTDEYSVVIKGPTGLNTNATASPISCNGTSTGATSVQVSGGTAPYTYLWNTGATTSTITAVGAGYYSVVVSDSRGCQSTANVTVNQAIALSLTMSSTPVNCQGVATGTASVSVTGGNPNYTYSWSNGANTQNINNLLSGTYYVTVSDALGCSKRDSVTLNYLNTAPLASITANGSTTICQGDSVKLTASNATSYLWNTGATSNIIYAKNAGTYNVTITDANGCTAVSSNITITNTPAPTWYIDADGDGYGSGNAISQCVRPLNGYLASELIAVNGDCNDASAVTNNKRQYFRFSSNTGYSTKLINQVSGSSYTDFNFEVEYVDSSNNLPLTGFPRLILDYEGNGSYSDANDRILVMTSDDPNDVTTSNGKRYIATVNGLPNGVNWKTSVLISDVNNCNVSFGSFNYPDVLQQPNVTIFANDITFSQRRPNTSSEIVVTALIRNESDYAAEDFVAHLVNQFDTNIVYPDVVVDFIPPHGVKLIQWNITTPSVPAWCPMQVIIDKTNVITEWNELDNSAVRPFVNGDFPVPGRILISSYVSPKVSYTATNNSITISGLANYTGTAVPLPDSSVAGATVTIRITETGAEFSGYTNAAGYYSISFPAPLSVGLYHITGNITDYTLEANFTDDFTIIPRPEPCSLPDLYATILLNRTSIVQGNSVTGQLRVVNGGMTATAATTIVTLTQSGGTDLINTTIPIPALASGQSYTVSIGSVTFATPGTYYIYANVDANAQVNECNESNSTFAGITVSPNLPDIIPYGGPSGTVYNCPNPTTGFTLYNAGGVASSSFTTKVFVKFNGTTVATYNHRVANINPGTTYSFTVPYIYESLGGYTYDVQCDVPTNSGGEVNELNEYNNEASYGPLNVIACKPNLYISACGSNVVSPADPAPPGFITLRASVVNAGNSEATGPIKVRFAYSSGENYDTTFTGNLLAGESRIVSYLAPVPNSTSTLLTITADPNNTIEEFTENDNGFSDVLCHDFEAVPLCGSNTFSGTAYLNQLATPFVGLAAHHLYTASQVKVKFEVSGPGITGTINLGYGILNNVSNNCTCPYAVTLPTPFVFSSMGTYTFTMTIDPDNTYLECDESNNVLITHWNVGNTPDMRILSEFINPTLLNPSAGQPVNFDVSYENIGRTNVNDSMKLKVLVNGVAHDSVKVRGLANGDHFTVRMPRTWSSLISGAHIIRAIIDADRQISENNETNNEATRAIIVGESANLFFRSLTPSQSAPQLGQTINIQAVIGNGGTQPCNAKVTFYYINNVGDSILIGQSNFVIAASGDTSVLMPWVVSDVSTNIIAVISNTSVLEYDYNDNTASTVLGNFNISFSNSNASCSGNADGVLTATASGGYPPYFYSWNNGRTGTTLTAAAGIYIVTVTDSLGQTITATDTIIKDPLIEVSNLSGLTNVCSITGTNQTTQYSVDNIPGAIYTWTKSSSLITLTGSGNAVSAKFASTYTTGTITVTISNVCGATVVRTLTIKKTAPLAPIAITGPTNPCLLIGTSNTATYTATPAANDFATTYRWTLPANVTLVSATADSLSVTIRFNSNFATGSATQRIIKVKSISYCASSVDKTLTIVNTLPTIPGVITGVANACMSLSLTDSLKYSISKLANVASYNWQVPTGATIVSHPNGLGENDTVIYVRYDSTFVSGTKIQLSAVSGCGVSALNAGLSILKTLPVTPGTISGNTDACPFMQSGVKSIGDTVLYSIAKVSTAKSYVWEAPLGAQIVGRVSTLAANDTAIKVIFSSSFVSGNIVVKSINDCGISIAKTLAITRKIPLAPGVISGSIDACPFMGTSTNATYTIRKVLNATSYNWNVPSGATLVSHPGGLGINDTIITVSYNRQFVSGSIQVRALSNCSVSNYTSLAISKKITTTPGVITGVTDACPLMGTSSYGYYSIAAVLNATSYIWVVPTGATIVGGQGTTNITVSYQNNFISGNITVSAVNNCSASAVRLLAITRKIPSTPGAITVTALNACPDRQIKYAIATVLNATSYEWKIPMGASYVGATNGNIITVQYPNGVILDSVTVKAKNNCFVSASRKITISLPACPTLFTKLANDKTNNSEVKKIEGDLQVQVSPNPTSTYFELLVKSKEKRTPIICKIMNVDGKLMELRNDILEGEKINLGQKYQSGVYFAMIIQGKNQKVLKLIKQ